MTSEEEPQASPSTGNPADDSSAAAPGSLPAVGVAGDSGLADALPADAEQPGVDEDRMLINEESLAASDERSASYRGLTPSQVELDNVAANGGAVASVVLGFWSLAWSLMTSWSMINAVLGLALGVWGLSSTRRRMAWTGILLCVIAIVLCSMTVNEWLQDWYSTLPGSGEETP